MKKIIFILLILLLGLGWWFFKKRNTPVAEKVPSIAGSLVARAEKRDLHAVITFTGDVAPDVQVEIKPEVGGIVKAIYTDAGQAVKRGQLIVEIDDSNLLIEKDSAQKNVAGSELEMDKTRRNFQRTEELFKSKLISRETYENQKSELEIAENNLQKSVSQLQLVEDRLKKTKIYAPTDGTVLYMNIIEGQVVVAAASVNSGTSLMTIADLSRLIINTHINQVDIAHIKKNMVAEFISDAIGTTSMRSTISFIAPIATIKNNVKGFEVKALIENPDPRLRPGMTVTMSVDTANVEGAVTVPISAVFKDENENHVVYIKKDGVSPTERRVKVGITNINFAEITEGLQSGEEVFLYRPKVISDQNHG